MGKGILDMIEIRDRQEEIDCAHSLAFHHRIILLVILRQSELDALADEFGHCCLFQSGDHFQPLIGAGLDQQIY